MRIRLRLLTKRRKLYIQLIVYTVLASFTPLMIIGTLFYTNIQKTMREQVQLAHDQYLQQTVGAMEIILDQITNNYSQLSLDSVFKEFELFPRGAYYEAISGAYPDDELPVMYAYLNSKARLTASLATLKHSNPLIQSVYLYDRGKQLILTWEGLSYRPQDFYDREWIDFTVNTTAVPAVMVSRQATRRDGGVSEVIPIVYTTLVPGNYLVVNLDANKLYETFFRKMDVDNRNAFLVVADSGQTMLYDETNEWNARIGADPLLLDRLADKRMLEYELNGEKLLLTARYSESLHWTFITAIPSDELFGSVIGIGKLLIAASLAVVAVMLLFGIATTRNIYNPIRHLLHLISKSADPTLNKAADVHHDAGELGVIRGSLEAALADRRSLQVRLQESLPANQEKFVRTLIHPHRLKDEEIAERMRYLGLDLDLEGIVLLLVAVEPGAAASSIGDEAIGKLHLIDLIQETIPLARKRIVMETYDNLIVVLANSRAEEFSESFAVAERVIRAAGEKLNVRCSIGIGNYCRTVHELVRAYEEAKEALRFRSIAGTGEVIYIEDVRLEGTPLFEYPAACEAAIMQQLIDGETEEALRSFAEFVRQVFAQRGKVHYHQIQDAFMRLLGAFVSAANNLRINLNEVMGEKDNLYSVLLRKADLNGAAAWFEEMIRRLSRHIGLAFREKSNRHIDEVMRILEREIGESISLAIIADRLKLNPSYLSRIFKEHRGVTFSEYLTKARIERSKQLLKDTTIKIKEIGEMVGYAQTNYFIRLFREHTGMTPGEYRRFHASGAAK